MLRSNMKPHSYAAKGFAEPMKTRIIANLYDRFGLTFPPNHFPNYLLSNAIIPGGTFHIFSVCLIKTCKTWACCVLWPSIHICHNCYSAKSSPWNGLFNQTKSIDTQHTWIEFEMEKKVSNKKWEWHIALCGHNTYKRKSTKSKTEKTKENTSIRSERLLCCCRECAALCL